MAEQDEDRPADLIRAAKRAPRAPLGVAAVAFTVIGLAGPLMLAGGIDPTPYRWYIVPLWLVVIGGILIFRRSFLRSVAEARTSRGRDASPPDQSE
jgi:hypothetical protein